MIWWRFGALALRSARAGSFSYSVRSSSRDPLDSPLIFADFASFCSLLCSAGIDSSYWTGTFWYFNAKLFWVCYHPLAISMIYFAVEFYWYSKLAALLRSFLGFARRTTISNSANALAGWTSLSADANFCSSGSSYCYDYALWPHFSFLFLLFYLIKIYLYKNRHFYFIYDLWWYRIN